MTPPSSTRFLVVAGIGLALGCSGPTDPSFTLAVNQARWSALRPTAYEFDYLRRTPWMAFACPGGYWHVSVQRGLVSAACMSTYQQDTGFHKTIDSLFADAAFAIQHDDLGAVQFDPTWGFPALVSFAAGPDRGWSELVATFSSDVPPSSSSRAPGEAP